MNGTEVSLLLRSALEFALAMQQLLGRAQAEGRDVTDEEVAGARAEALLSRQRLVDSKPPV